jgi:hypothetical protein
VLGVEMEPIRGPYHQAPARPGRMWVGTCEPDLAVEVVNESGAPVPGARVWIRQRVHAHAVEESMGIDEYRTLPIEADEYGIAHVCGPKQVPPIPALQGIGGGWVAGDGGEIVAELGARHGTLRPPFGRPLVIAAPETK